MDGSLVFLFFRILVAPFWVCLFVHLLQAFDAVVHIHLRGGQVGVPEQFLDRIQVGAVVRKMGGERVPQHVRTALFDGGYSRQVLVYDVVNTFRAKAFAFSVEEKPGLIGGREHV